AAFHQPVPRGMELDLVDAGAEAVDGMVHRRVLVREVPVLACLGRPGQPADGVEVAADGRRVLAGERGDRVLQGNVGRGDVDAVERHGLVGGDALHGIHGPTVERAPDSAAGIACVLWTGIARVRYGPTHAWADRARRLLRGHRPSGRRTARDPSPLAA